MSRTGKKRFLRDAQDYIRLNGPSTASQLHECCRFTKSGKLMRDSPSRKQAQQLLARSSLFDSSTTQVGYTDPARFTTYEVKLYSLRGEE